MRGHLGSHSFVNCCFNGGDNQHCPGINCYQDKECL